MSAYSRLIDYERISNVCKSIGAYLLADMAHVSGLMAAGHIPTPFSYADVVTTTTHKGLRGPRGALIFSKKAREIKDTKGNVTYENMSDKIDQSVFPGH